MGLATNINGVSLMRFWAFIGVLSPVLFFLKIILFAQAIYLASIDPVTAQFKHHPQWPQIREPAIPFDQHSNRIKRLGPKRMLKLSSNDSIPCVQLLSHLGGGRIKFEVVHAHSEIQPYFKDKPEVRWDSVLLRFLGTVGKTPLTFFGSVVTTNGINYLGKGPFQYFGIGNHDNSFQRAIEASTIQGTIGEFYGKKAPLRHWRKYVKDAYKDAEADFSIWRGVEGVRLRYADDSEPPSRSERIEVTPKDFLAFRFLNSIFRSELGIINQMGITYRGIPVVIRWQDEFFKDPDFREEQRKSDLDFGDAFRRKTLSIRRSFPDDMPFEEQLARDVEDSEVEPEADEDEI